MHADVKADEADKTDAELAASLSRGHEIAEKLQMVHENDAGDLIKDLDQVQVSGLHGHKIDQVNDHSHGNRILDLKLEP